MPTRDLEGALTIPRVRRHLAPLGLSLETVAEKSVMLQARTNYVAVESPGGGTYRRVLLGIGVCLSFVPYAAIPVGNSSAIQFSQLALVGAGLLGVAKARRQLFVLYALIMTPIVVSLAALLFQRVSYLNLQIGLKATVNYSATIACVLGAAALVEIEDLFVLLKALITGISLNGLVGLYQWYEFRHGVFPLFSMFQLNPSFAKFSPAAARLYVIYSPRPMGLFSEPSAMAACLGPGMILMLLVFAMVENHRKAASRWLGVSVVVASILGLAVLAVSRSGMAPVALVGTLATILILGRRGDQGPSIPAAWRTHKVMKRLALVMFLSAGGALLELQVRFAKSSGTGESWHARWQSLTIGFHLLFSTIETMFLGVGIGQSSRLVSAAAPATVYLWGFSTPGAIYSVLGDYVVETGIFGGTVLILTLVFIGIRTSATRRFRGVTALLAAVWFAGCVASTSYWTLSPLWLTLGIFAVWPTFSSMGAHSRQASPNPQSATHRHRSIAS